ncbi:butyrophilin subfamily 3 member A3 [Xenopus laevis]|uniref:Butyrophilin subfamily 3 member A3 n=1 Tax=Xenopus laevis TaxID=8355 RepID=A0A8J1KR11_XENLA|nr:butyrophilin subfamily 3 member A3 [Xenopus laevis]
MAYVAVRAELNCSVCMEIYTGPVTLPCGHNFCQRCIEITWDTQVEMEESPSCPECRKRFGRRPELRRNQTLHNIALGLRATHPPQDGTGIYCTYCDSPVPAAKSCLLCEASLCAQHVTMHSKAKEHILTAPTTSLGNRKCPAHRKLLESYCCDDGTCICVSCHLERDSGRSEEGDDEEDRELSPAVSLDENLILVTLMIGLEGIVADVKGKVYGQEATEMFLDMNTAGQLVDIAGDNDTVAYIGTEQGHPEVPQRFKDHPQVLSTNSFSSGRHYWNIEVTMTGDWGVGVAYPSIAREGAESLLGNNNKSWVLYKTDDEYSVRHDSQHAILPNAPLSEGIKISLDYEAGRLSFYELSEPIRHLHTFTASFTEPLHAAYWVWDCVWVRT